MIFLKKYYLLLFIALFSVLNVFSQASTESATLDSSNYIIVKLIDIEGNDKTKDHIILRELDFKVGDTLFLKDTSSIISQSKNKLYNTALFNDTEFNFIVVDNKEAYLLLKVEERWYIWPSPIFEIGDRNFNEWWQDRDKEANRLDYGLRFRWENFRGRAELLKIVVQTGFTKKFEIFHTVPYINKNQKTGIKYGASYSTNNKVAYNTTFDKLAYINYDSPIRKRFYSFIESTYRPHFYTKHALRLTLKNNRINDTIAVLNPNYFGNSNTKLNYFSFSYTFDYDKTDIQAYPTKGGYAFLNITQTGLGLLGDLNLLTSDVGGAYFNPLGKRVSTAHNGYIKLTKQKNTAYFNMLGLGYGQNFVRGFERNVIDAQHYAFTRNSIRYKFAEFKHDMTGSMPIKQFEKVPYKFYFTGFIDAGVANYNYASSTNQLNKKALIGYGLGIDFVTYYDLVIRLEYSITNNNTKGLFLHFAQAF